MLPAFDYPLTTTPEFKVRRRQRKTDVHPPRGIGPFEAKSSTIGNIQPPCHYVPVGTVDF